LPQTGGKRVIYQAALISTHQDGFPRFLARSARRGDAGHREAGATQPKSLGKPPLRSQMQPFGGRRKALPMRRIASGCPPTRRAASAISMGRYQRNLVSGQFVSGCGAIGLPLPGPVATPFDALFLFWPAGRIFYTGWSRRTRMVNVWNARCGKDSWTCIPQYQLTR